MNLLVNLGKFGDIINVLPMAFMLSKQLGGKIKWLVGKEWASVLDGASYVEPVIFDGRDDELSRALQEYRGHQNLVTQAWRNPDRERHTDSFAKEQWRYAGLLDERGKWPLVFDQRSPQREQELIKSYLPWNSRQVPRVLVGTTSVSTPYRHAQRLISELGQLNADIILLDNVKAERLYDLIGLYDAADLLVTIDTCHLHLARASQTPVIALVNNGWQGAVPPPQTIAAWRYAELGDDITPVVEAAKKQLARKVDSMAVVFQTFKPDTDRHKRAFATHPEGSIYSKHDYPPSMKEMLQEGLDANKDVIVFTNDDVTFLPDTLDKIKRHATKFDFGCSRRPRDPVHCGREIFWFRSDWLRKNWEKVPNPYWSVQKPDLIMCRWLRHLKGIPTTLANLDYDFSPVDVPDIVYHEDHPSHWSNPEVENSKEGLYNEYLWEKGI